MPSPKPNPRKSAVIHDAERLPPKDSELVSLSRVATINLGAVLFDRGLKTGEILERMSGIPVGKVVPDPVVLDPRHVLDNIRDNGISATLLFKLGIRDSLSKTLGPVTAQEVKRLLEFFKFLDPLDEATGYRVTVVRNDRSALKAAGFIKPELAGSLFFRVMDTASLHAHEGVYSAARKTDHQAGGHNRELKKIEPFVARVERLIDALTLWRVLETKQRYNLQRSSARLGATFERALKFARNESKRRAYILGLRAVGLKDDTQRFNILASRTRYEVLTQKLLKRLGEIPSIDKFNRVDRTSLIAAMIEQEVIMRHIHMRAKATAELAAKLCQKKTFNVDGYLISIGLANESVARLVTRPFCAFRDSFLDARAVFTMNASRGRSAEAGAAIEGVATIAQLGLVEMSLQWSRFYLVAGQAGVKAARDQFKKAKGLLEGLQLEPHFSDLPAAIDKLDTACIEFGKASKQDLNKAKKALQAAFKNASIEQRLLTS